MNIDDLDLRELLEAHPKGGVIRFAGQRALIFDAVALGLLRRELIQILGLTAARGLLTRFGYSHGWRTAEGLRDHFPWDDERQWRIAGGRLHTLQGLVRQEPVPERPEDPDAPFAESIWHDSYEAEQHLLHIGQSDEAVCWTLSGFASGYLSFCNGREIVCVEERCRGRGDAVCHVTGRFKEEWAERERPELAWYDTVCLDAALERVTSSLKQVERTLSTRRRELGIVDESELRAGIVARSASMRRAIDLALRVARVDSTVLVTGESGVGKERIARLVHDSSAREAGPFLAINCGAVTDTLLESELFGHARGAFTGATSDRPGLFEAAGGGTLFLDEVGELSQAMQVKLLRVLQEREVRRVGENKSRRVDVRVVAATNRDLRAEVESGGFRQDLFYRLRVIEIPVPPLRTRKEDVLPLARSFLLSLNESMKLQKLGFAPDAADQLLRYDWPGNVRELQNAVERAVVLAEGDRIDSGDLPEEVRSPAVSIQGAIAAGSTLADLERRAILGALDAHGGNRTRAAEQLGIGAATLYRKLKIYGSTVQH